MNTSPNSLSAAASHFHFSEAHVLQIGKPEEKEESTDNTARYSSHVVTSITSDTHHYRQAAHSDLAGVDSQTIVPNPDKRWISFRKIQLEKYTQSLLFGKKGMCKDAIKELNALNEKIEHYGSKVNKIKVSRYKHKSPTLLPNTCISATFTPCQWLYHSIFRQDKSVPYYASDLFRFNYFRAEAIAEFNIRWPEKIIIKNIHNDEVVTEIRSKGVEKLFGSNEAPDRSSFTRHINRILYEFGFSVILSTTSIKPFDCCGDIMIKVKPRL